MPTDTYRQPDDPGVPSFLQASDAGVDGQAPIGDDWAGFDPRPYHELPISRLAIAVAAVFWSLIVWIVWKAVT